MTLRFNLHAWRVAAAAALALVGAGYAGGASAQAFGIDATGKLYHVDRGWSASFNYLCLNGECYTGTRTNGRFERSVSVTPGATYTLEFKVQDNATGQCLTGNHTLTYAAGGASLASTPCSGGGVADTQLPTVPGGLAGTGTSSSSIALTWSASTDNVGVTRYDIYRGTTLAGSSANTSFTNTGLSASTSYSYRVRACDAAGNCSAQSTAVNVSTTASGGGGGGGDTLLPTVPAGLSGTATSGTSIALTWNAASDNVGVTRYDVYRDGNLAGSNAATNFNSTGLTAATPYSFRVRACDAAGNCSAQSAAVSVTTTGVPSVLDWTTNAYSDHNIGPAPRPNPPDALATPLNGYAPTTNGFAFDIDGSTLRWRWGPGIVKAANDADLEMHCSTDNGMTFRKTTLAAGVATIPCSGTYTYFFRYKQPGLLTNNPSTQWAYTGYFTTAGARVNPHAYAAFTDGSANWMRFRHPIAHDGVTAAILDAMHNNDLLRNLDRYTLWVDDAPGNVRLGFQIAGSVLRVESMTRADNPNGQQFFAVNQNPGFGDAFSYGQVVSFEITAVAGRTGAQTYNDFTHYTIGYGWSSKYGDPRLQSAGKASTSQLFSDSGAYSNLEKNAVFTQPMVTIHKEDMIDDFIVGHHLFHGLDPKVRATTAFGAVKIGSTTCGTCHFRDGRGSAPVNIPGKGMRLPPPIYGTKLLESIVGRTAGFTWDGSQPTVAAQVNNALVVDHGVQPSSLPGRVVDLLVKYTEALTVPSRNPNSYDTPGVEEGDRLFNQAGCGGCHTPVQRTSPTAETHLRNLVLRPYTDMKVWNVNGGNFRTAPLWGLGHNLEILRRNGRAELYMHDGSATSIDAAIQKHTGDAAAARASYNALTPQQRENVVKFVETL